MKTENITDFDALNGKEFAFYGATEQQFKIGSMIWEVLEDEEDGYRSCLGAIERKVSDAIFFKRSIAKVRVVVDDGDYKLIDVKDGHEWLTFGTDHSDSYYPWFYFNYQPKAPGVAQEPKE